MASSAEVAGSGMDAVSGPLPPGQAIAKTVKSRSSTNPSSLKSPSAKPCPAEKCSLRRRAQDRSAMIVSRNQHVTDQTTAEVNKTLQESDVGELRPKPMKRIACFRPSSRSREEARHIR